MKRSVLNPVDLSMYSSLLASFFMNDDGTLLLARYSGVYGKGSAGNGDGAFMFSTLAAYYYLSEPPCIILDLSCLQYEWGNTISKTINFYGEVSRDESEQVRKVIVIAKGRTLAALEGLNRCLNVSTAIFVETEEQAIDLAVIEVEKYFE
jgi:hypothetical protein